MGVSIKKLDESDWKVYKDLRLQMLSEEPQAYSQTFGEVSKRSDDEWREKTISGNMAALIISIDGVPVGMNGLYYENTDTVSIWGMFIKKEFRGMGLSRKLMEAIEEEIRKDTIVKKIQVFVSSSQVSAHKLYESMGYKEVKRERGKVQHGGKSYDEIFMEKQVFQLY